MLSLVHRLPVEIRTLLYLTLGIHDLRNLILAYPSLSKEVLIVKDVAGHWGLCSTLFYPFTDIEVCRLSQYQDPLYRYKASRRFAITVFELVNEDHFADDTRFWTTGTRPFTGVVKDNSIIYVRLPLSDNKDNESIHPFYSRHSTLELFRKLCPRVHVDPVEFPILQPKSLTVKHSIDKCNLLDISDADLAGRKVNLDLPWARELTIRVLPRNDTPKIENINAEQVMKFTLFYGRVFPRICNVKLGYRRMCRTQKPAFRLIHYDAYPAHVTYPLPPCLTPENLDSSVHSMGVKHFPEVHLIGGPDVLFKKVLHRNLSRMYWKRTNYQHLEIWDQNMTLPLAQCKRLAALYFETTVPHTIMPALDLSVLSRLSIVSYDPWLDISPFAKSFVDVHVSHLSHLLIHSYAPEVDDPVLLKVPINWLNTSRILRHGQPLAHLDLYGCVFPEEVSRERRLPRDNGVRFQWNDVSWRNMKGKYADLDNQPITPLAVQILSFPARDQAGHERHPREVQAIQQLVRRIDPNILPGPVVDQLDEMLAEL